MCAKQEGRLLVAFFKATQAKRIFHSRPEQTVDASLQRSFEMFAKIEYHRESR